MSLPRDKIEATLSSQQSTYEHIQSMSATFLSLTAATIAAIAGLNSAGIVEIKIFDIPNVPEISGKLIFVPNYIYISKQSVSQIFKITLNYTSLYLISAIILFLLSIFYFIICLNAKPLHPEKYVRTELEKPFNIKKKKQNTIETKWLEKNAKELEELVENFKHGKDRAKQGFLLAGFSTYGFIGIATNEPNPYLFIIWLTVPFLLFSYFFGFMIRYIINTYYLLKSLHQSVLKWMFEDKSIFEFKIRDVPKHIITLLTNGQYTKKFNVLENFDLLFVSVFLIPATYLNVRAILFLISNIVIESDKIL